METRAESGHKADIPGYATFVEELQAALNHLNDPAFQPGSGLSLRLGLLAGLPHWGEPLRQAIHKLRPLPGTPAQSRGHRLYQVLLHRYLHDETQEVAAEQLGITARHLRREQSDAVQALAHLLWEGVETTTPDEWSSQLRQELSALQRGASSHTSDAGETVQRVVELLTPVLERSGVALALGQLSPGLMVAVQSTGLRQLLVRLLTEWGRHLAEGHITLRARRLSQEIEIHLSGSPAAIDHLPDDPLVQEMLSQFGGGLAVEQAANATHLRLRLAAAPPLRVLVVDDNEDLHHFYRRFVANTRYQIVSITDGEALLPLLEEIHPAAVILDVMLPSTDGWELLTQLRQHPLGKSIPVLVCSVIQEEELARALGASGYIPKPVGRKDLLHALDTALL